jgi:hypothetical protein
MTRVENETAGHVGPGVEIGLQSASAEQLQPSTLTRSLANPLSTDDDEESTDHGTRLRTPSGNSDQHQDLFLCEE